MITVPGYRILRRLHEGSRTIIYQGTRIADNRAVAVKVFPADQLTPENIDILRQENELARQLDLDGVMKPLGIENSDHGPALILQDLGGIPLADILAQRPMELGLFLEVMIQLARTLSELHRRGITHRNISPSSIFINSDTRRAELTDIAVVPVLRQDRFPAAGSSVLYVSPEQTGRMNRIVDYRTDLYSLGVVCYQALTGDVPFRSADALALVHSHLALAPEPPAAVNPSIPGPLSEIVMKLLAKNAEDRYQSGSGLQADLERCREQLEKEGRIEPFDPGASDAPQILAAPGKLYDREPELAVLRSSLERILLGASELVLVTGAPGIGKTALINELKWPVSAERGCFISGKYDQLKKNVPFSSFIFAFKQIIRQVLTENEEQVRLWRTLLLEALGVNGQLIIDVIPEVELITGKQPAIAPASPAESLNRFNRVIQNFVGVFARPDHPLVLFLDDLQWIDQASIDLILTLIADPRLKHFLIVGAYRSNEVTAGHPLLFLLDQLQTTRTATTVVLRPLAGEQVEQMVSDTLRCSRERSGPLARVIHMKTGGNPFFINQMLRMFSEEKILLHAPSRGWQWNIDEITRLHISDNVVDLLVDKIARLDPGTMEVLKLASCIGNRFDLETLTIVHDHPAEGTMEQLNQAVREGLVIPTEDNYLFFHDRIQEAAYSLLPAAEKKRTHYRIGNLVLQSTPEKQLLSKIFYIVDQLNAGSDLIAGGDEKERLARLNLAAGRKAKASTAYASAERYLSKGLTLLASDRWQERPALTRDLALACAECRYLLGFLKEAELLFSEILRNARSPLEKAELFKIRVALSLNRGRSREAVELAREGLRVLGLSIPFKPGPLTIMAEIVRIKWHIGRRSADDLIRLPQLNDPARQIMTDILINMGPAAYFHDKNLFTLAMLKVFTISLRYGQTKAATIGYGAYGLVQSAVLGKYGSGFEFADFAVRLSRQHDDLSVRVVCDFILAALVNHWSNHLNSSIELFVDGYECGLESGNVLFGGYCAGVHAYTRLVKGDRLDDVLHQTEQYLEVLKQHQHEDMVLAVTAFYRTALALLGETDGPTSLSGDTFDEAAFAGQLMQDGRQFLFCVYQVTKLPLLYLYEEHEDARQAAEHVQKNRDYLMGMYYLVQHNFYYSLTLAALVPTASPRAGRSYRRRMRKNQRILGTWARNCPSNFRHKYLLVNAEIARISGRLQEAEDLYDSAIQLAAESGFLHEVAIGNELAARFHLARGRLQVARTYFAEAISCYELWGAAAKVRQLRKQQASLFRHPEARGAAAGSGDPLRLPSSPALDMTTVLKLSQAISREISLERLLPDLMRIVIENAGARRGFLLMERDGRLCVEAQGSAETAHFSAVRSLPFEEGTLPESVINYTSRTREAVVLDDAAHEGMFSNDPVIRLRGAKSVLAVPITSKGLIGVLYLENDLVSHAFTPERIDVLKALSSQIAISLANARLFDEARRARESLEESELKFRALAETMQAGIVIYRDERFLYVNPAIELITGYSRAEFADLTFSIIIHPDFLGLVRSRAADRLAGKPVPAQYEFKIVSRSGEERWVMSTAGSILYGREEALIATLIDVTEQKRAEEERLRLFEENERQYRERIEEERRHQREKENILMDIHDGIGGIISNIGLLAEIVGKAETAAKAAKPLATLARLAREGSSEIHSLMFSLDSRDHTWRALAAELRSHGTRLLTPHAIEFSMDAGIDEAAEPPGPLLFLHLFRIYREVLTNVIKHAVATAVAVDFQVSPGRMALSVRDNGRGFDAAADEGKGRGLRNMKARAAEIGGTVAIETGGGTTVSLVIPLSPGRWP